MNRVFFASRLGAVLGIGTIGVACGGKVIFEASSGAGTTGVGGAGTSGASGPTTSNTTGAVTGGTTGSGCTAVPKLANEQVQNVCFNKGSSCPPISDPTLPSELTTVIDAGATCPDYRTVDSVACANPTATACCYTVITKPNCQLGRPFRVDDEARAAAATKRADWCDRIAPTPVEALGDAARADLAVRWTRDALAEHASIAAFARVTLELLAVGAPAHLVRDTQAAMGDEIRHAEQSFALASRYAGRSIGPDTLPIGVEAPSTSLAAIAASTVRDGCIEETISALVAAEARDAATDPQVRATLTEIAADEAHHAELAWRTVDWALSIGGPDVARSVANAFEQHLVLPERSSDASTPHLRAHGQLSGAEKANVRADAVLNLLRDAARALLAKHDPALSPVVAPQMV